MIRGFNSQEDAAALGDDLLFSIMNHALILVCKFLEIWKEFGSLVPDNPRVLEIRRKVQPIIDRIRVWPALEQYRNTALAHPYLTRDGKIIGPWQLTGEEVAPTYHAETLLLLNCVNMAVVSILVAFPEQYAGIKPLLIAELGDPSKGPGVSRGQEIRRALKPISEQVTESLAEIGVVFNGPIVDEFMAALRPRGPGPHAPPHDLGES